MIFTLFFFPFSYSQISNFLHSDKPLALYAFSNDKKVINRISMETTSGGFIANDCLMHFSVAQLPFGGVGASGMGSYHGKKSFDTFSHAKSSMFKDQNLEFANTIRYPPYTESKQKMVKSMVGKTVNMSEPGKLQKYVLLKKKNQKLNVFYYQDVIGLVLVMPNRPPNHFTSYVQNAMCSRHPVKQNIKKQPSAQTMCIKERLGRRSALAGCSSKARSQTSLTTSTCTMQQSIVPGKGRASHYYHPLLSLFYFIFTRSEDVLEFDKHTHKREDVHWQEAVAED